MQTGHRFRVTLLRIVVLAIGLVIGGRLYQLQVLSCEGLRARATNQHQSREEVTVTRGALLDRNGEVMAISLAAESLFAHPRRVQQPGLAAGLLSPVLGQSRAALLDRLSLDKPFVYLQRSLDSERAKQIRGLDLPVGDNLPFGFLDSSKRLYPRGKLAVHVLGFADIDGKGVEGLELQFDEVLRGDPIVYQIQQDGRNGRLRQKVGAPEKKPNDLVLSIDLFLQHVTERELDRAMRETGAQAASAIVIDPATGQILALANRPAADPNSYGRSLASARLNRAVVLQYEPGSTFKIVTMAAALEEGAVRPDQQIFCENGSFFSGGRRFRDTSPHGVLSVREIVQKSSNIGMVKVVNRLEGRTLQDYILRFGFGSRTGIELPGELKGTVRPVTEWSDYSQSSLAFGQEIGVTVLQMATAIATVANDGVLVPPRIVLGSRDDLGRLSRMEPANARRVISSRTARELTSMLEGVITDGTGTRARLSGYRLAGKSGTAQKIVGRGYSETDYVASFGGFGPVNLPRVAVLVVLDSPQDERHQGGRVAAPVFRRIIADALTYLRVPSDHESISVARLPERAGAEARVGANGASVASGAYR